MKLQELFYCQDLQEDLTRRSALAGLGSMLGMKTAGATSRPRDIVIPDKYTALSSNRARETELINLAQRAGIQGRELAAFLAQLAHESLGFNQMQETGDTRKYDPQHNPRKAAQLGNTQPGDGARYRGRGYIHLTGRENYRRLGNQLGLPLEDQPDQAATPAIAASIAIRYWKTRVQPRVSNWDDVREVTKTINPGETGASLPDRAANYQHYLGRIVRRRADTENGDNKPG
jgi:predicted chitinase